MPSALYIACGVETDAPLDRWNFLFPFRSFYAGFCRGIFSSATTSSPLNGCMNCNNNNQRHCNIDRELQLLLERMSKSRKELEDFEMHWHRPLATPAPALGPSPSSQLPPSPSPPPPPPPSEQPQQQSAAVQTCDKGIQTHEDERLLVYQALLEDKIEQFKEQELMIGRLQEHLAIVKEQLADALEAAAAATAAAAAAGVTTTTSIADS